MTSARRLASGPLVGVALAVSLARAGVPSPVSLSPPSGRVDEQTIVSLTGDGFEAASRVSLLNGGPFLTATHALAGGAAGATIDWPYVYVANYDHQSKLGGVRIIDVADPFSPVEAGRFDTGDAGFDVAVSNGLAYIAFLDPYTYLGGLHIVDVSDPSATRRLGTYYTFYFPTSVVVRGHHAFVSDSVLGLQIIDVSNPAMPFLAGALDLPGTESDLALAGSLAYLACGEGGVQITDVSDPTNPVFVGGLAEAGDLAQGVAVAGGKAFIADTVKGLRIIDVSDPAHPLLESQYPTADISYGVAVAGSRAYLADGFNGLQVLDVSDSTAPVLLGGVGAAGSSGIFESAVVLDGIAYVSDGLAGLRVVDVGDPASPAPAGGEETPGDAQGIALSGGLAFIADGASGLQIFDVEDPSSPLAVGSFGTPGEAKGVAAGANFAYVAAGSDGLLIVDVTDPSHPAQAAMLDTSGDAQGVAVSGAFAYVADGSPGLRVIDVSSPASPLLVGTFNTPGSARGVAFSGGYVYVADDFRGLQVIDVTAPAAPFRAGGYDTPGRAVGVVVSGPYAYVADLNRGIQVIDVSAPAHPVSIGEYATAGSVSGVAVVGEVLLAADGLKGLEAFDISDPYHLVQIGGYDTPGSAMAVAASGQHAFVADFGRGLRIVRLNPPVLQQESPTPTTMDATIPAGLSPGPYHVLVTNPAGETATLFNGYHACAARELSASLDPVIDPVSGSVSLPIPWRLVLDGDETFFGPGPVHQALLKLPTLPSDLVEEFLPAESPGRLAIELRLAATGEAGLLRLIGDADQASALWESARGAGGFDLPRLDDRSYGEFTISLLREDSHGQPAPRAGGPFTARAGWIPFPTDYRYEFTEGRLTSASTSGIGTDLVFETVAFDGRFCPTIAQTSFRATLREMCSSAGSQPGLDLPCEAAPPGADSLNRAVPSFLGVSPGASLRD